MFRLDALNLTFNGTPAPRFIRSAKDFHCCHGSQLENGGGLPTLGQGQVVAPSGGVKISQIFFFPNNLMGQTGAASATRALYWSAVVKKAECKSRAVDFTGLSASLPSPVASVLERGRRVWVGRLVGEVFQAHNTGRRTRGKPGTHSVLGTPLRFPPPEWAGGGGWGKEGLGCLGCCPHSLTLDEWMHYCWGFFFPYSPDYEDINMTLGCYSSVVFLCIK